MKMKSSNPTTRYGSRIASCSARQRVVLPALDGPFTRMSCGQGVVLATGFLPLHQMNNCHCVTSAAQSTHSVAPVKCPPSYRALGSAQAARAVAANYLAFIEQRTHTQRLR